MCNVTQISIVETEIFKKYFSKVKILSHDMALGAQWVLSLMGADEQGTERKVTRGNEGQRGSFDFSTPTRMRNLTE